MLTASNFEYGVVASRPDQMYAWPGLTRINERELLVSASERQSHHSPDGRTVIMRSTDNGKTWQLPRELYNSELDDRDANLLTMPDGTLVLTSFTSDNFTKQVGEKLLPEWEARIGRVTDKMREELLCAWSLRSFDGGETWETVPNRLPLGAHAGPSLLSDGSLIYLGHMPAEVGLVMGVAKSFDAGKTWEVTGQVPGERVVNEEGVLWPVANENHVLEIAPGKLIAMFRTAPDGSKYLYQSNSEDNGKTWSQPVETPIWGYPAHLLRLQSGPILCSYGHRRKPFGIKAVLSYDDGRTWDVDNIITVYEWPENPPDQGYPVAVELSPGEILTVFYCSYKDCPHIPPEVRKTITEPAGILSAKYHLA
ncbi:MAG: exo-alpha-sialidase [Phycisphaerae bacterium]|nr:exo-alpha-sialidase [Phycisphaerae bacterium]